MREKKQGRREAGRFSSSLKRFPSQGLCKAFLLFFLILSGCSTAPWRLSNPQREMLKARDKVMPSVVHIRPLREVQIRGKKEKVLTTGSGVIYSHDGYVITNYHVVGKTKKVFCTLYNKEEVTAHAVASDSLTDLAVLKLDLEEKNLKEVPAAPVGDSDSLQIGEWVMAMGSPWGLSRSLSLGVVSSIERYLPEAQVSPLSTWIQTDAVINPGNSGGPLVNLKGEVVGINSRAILAGGSLGFAIPINLVKQVVPELIEKGKVTRSWIGVQWQPMSVLAPSLPVDNQRGVVVADVEPGSPAHKAGLRAGDIAISFNKKAVSARFIEELPEFRNLIASTPVGEEISLGVMREGKPLLLSMTTVEGEKEEPDEFECPSWGVVVGEVTSEVARRLNIEDKSGVLVLGVEEGSPADVANLFEGDLIQFVDSERVEDLNAFKNLYAQGEEGQKSMVLLETKRASFFRYVLLKPSYKKNLHEG